MADGANRLASALFSRYIELDQGDKKGKIPRLIEEAACVKERGLAAESLKKPAAKQAPLRRGTSRQFREAPRDAPRHKSLFELAALQ
jgi:hypothetical protein